MALTSEISALTQKYYHPILVDNIFSSNSLFQRARKKWYEVVDGGTSIEVPIAYATTTAAGSYSGAQTLDTTANDQITSLAFDWKQYYANITITGLDELKNSGKQKIVDFLKAKVQLAEKSLANSLGTALFNLGTAANDLIGLRLGIDSAGTYGGVSRTTYTWLAAQEDGSTTVLSLSAMQSLFGDCTVGNDKPTVAITTQDIYDDYWSLLQPQQRFTDKNTADGGFTNLMFNGIPVIVDSHCPASHLFFINEDYIGIRAAKQRNFYFRPFQQPENQDVSTAKIFWTGYLFINNCRMHGKFNALA